MQRSNPFDSPRATSVIETEELRNQPPRSVGDALKDEPAVLVSQPSYGFQSPNLRGLGEGRVQILVDGIRLNTTITSTIPGGLTNLNLVDPFTVNAIEVVRGPGMNTYSDGGLGGSIFLRTMRPTPIAGSSVELSAGVRGIYASPDQGIQGSLFGSGRWNRFTLETAFSARRFQDLSGGSQTGRQPFTGYSEGGLYIGGGVDLGKGSLIVVFQGVRQYDGIRSERSQPGDMLVLPEVARDLAYLRYDGDFEAKGHPVEVSATAYYQRQSELVLREQVPIDSLLRLQSRVDVVGFTARVRTDLGRAGSLVAGAEGAFEWVSSAASRSMLHLGTDTSSAVASPEARYPDGARAQSLALFLQDEIDLERLLRGQESERPGRLRLLIGGRAGSSFLQIGRDDRLQRLLGNMVASGLPDRQLQNPLYAGSVHLRYEPVAGLALLGGGLIGVRTPSLDDQSRLDAGRPGLLLPAALPLRAESAYAAELGARAVYHRLEGSAYYAFTYLDSPIVVVPFAVAGQSCLSSVDGSSCTRFLTRQNAAAAKLHSVEGNLRVYLLWGLSALASVTYTYEADGEAGSPPLGRVPPVHGLAAIEYARPRTLFSYAQLVLRWAGPQQRLATEDLFDPTLCLPSQVPASATSPAMAGCRGTPGFYAVSARGALRLSRQIHLTGVVTNLTNNSYRFYGSGVDGPGLGVNLAIEANY